MSNQDSNSIRNTSYANPQLIKQEYSSASNAQLDKEKKHNQVKVAIISSTPTPYRDQVYDMIASKLGDAFKVYYCGSKEPIREWNLKRLNHNHAFLKGWNIRKKGGWSFVYFNFNVWKYLIKEKPQAVITTGFNPTHLFGWMYCLLFRKAHIPFTDSWSHADSVLTLIHLVVRKLVFTTSKAFLGPGKRTLELYQSYGADPSKFYQSHLAANTQIFSIYKSFQERTYDLMFAGQIHVRKSPLFFVEVARRVQQTFPNLKVLILGSGPKEKEMIHALEEANISYHFPGFIQPDDLPAYYASSKLFLFPTKLDAWGVVANEALASGTPVLITPFAGAADDLVLDGENGYVLDLEIDKWAEKITYLFNNPQKWQMLSMKGLTSKQEYNYENASNGIINAWKFIQEGKKK